MGRLELLMKTLKNESIIINSSISYKQGEEELKNIIRRSDGRWMYRKQTENKRITLYATTQKELLKKIKSIKNKDYETENKNSLSFYELALIWYELYKKDKISTHKRYLAYINNEFNNEKFKKNINKFTLEELQLYINNIQEHRKADYLHSIITNVFKYAKIKKVIKEDLGLYLEPPVNKGEKGSAFTYKEQVLIMNNLDKTPIKNEILFYLLTGARREEAIKTKLKHINFEKNIIFIDGTKSKTSKRWVPISETFKNILKENFDSMFKYNKDHYTKEFSKYLELLGIENKSLHDCRHTFSTNLYYLRVPDKERQSYMGHASIKMTNDIYTTLDPTITKEDILKLYNNLYPKFDY